MCLRARAKIVVDKARDLCIMGRMSVTITYEFQCGGCFAKRQGERRRAVKREFSSFSGKPYGLGHFSLNIPQPDPPDDWVAFDPYTGCCYCPECWKEIIEPEQA